MFSYAMVTSANADIRVGGNIVGRIQNLTINNNYNLQKMQTLYKNEYQAFVPGQTEITVTAQKAFVEYDNFLTTIASLATAIKNSVLNLTSNANNSMLSNILNLATGAVSPIVKKDNFNERFIEDTVKINEILDKLKKSTGSIGDLFSRVKFDIEVLRPYEKGSGFVKNESTVMWKLEDCQLNARSITLDVGRVVIMENLTILAKRIIDVEVGESNKISPLTPSDIMSNLF